MRWTSWRRWACPALLLLFILISYSRLTTMQGVVITDDGFTSDLMNAEFPWRVAAGRMVRGGEWPLWSPEMGGGYPLLAGGGGTEPLALFLFTVFPPPIALNLLMLLILGIAGLGAYVYARCIGASRAGALLCGMTFSFSGFMVCQLKHLGAATCVSWFPLALCFLERSLRGPDTAPPVDGAVEIPVDGAVEIPEGGHPLAVRLRYLGGFALVFGLQILTGFPQSAYIAGLTYGAYAALRLPVLLWSRVPWRLLLGIFLGLGVACVLAVGVGAIQLVPQQELSQLSQRVGRLNLDQAAHVAFWPPNLWMFLSPYINGDISNLSYTGRSVFWEDYGYVGLAPLLLGVYALYASLVRRFRRWHVVVWIVLGAGALLMVVSKATPVFALAHRYLPGMDIFRFPTRFMFVVGLALAVLGGLGLTRLQLWAAAIRERGRLRWLPWLVVPLLGLAALDLVHHQLRQNAIVDAALWFREPRTVQAIRRHGAGLYRVHAVGAMESHRAAFQQARGWSDVAPYLRQREHLQVNSNMLWGLSSPDCYAGLVTRWQRDVWGPGGLVARTDLRRRTPVGGRLSFLRLMALWNVRYLVAPRQLELQGEATPLERGVTGAGTSAVPGGLRQIGAGEQTAVYELASALPRAFFAPDALVARHRGEAVALLLDPSFDLGRRVVLEREPPGAAPPTIPSSATPAPVGPAGTVEVQSYRPTEVVVRTAQRTGGFLVLSDTWYPGWTAELDGRQELPILRANIAQRAVALPPGEHTVRFVFKSGSVRTGGLISLVSLVALGIGALLVPWLSVSRRRERSRPVA